MPDGEQQRTYRYLCALWQGTTFRPQHWLVSEMSRVQEAGEEMRDLQMIMSGIAGIAAFVLAFRGQMQWAILMVLQAILVAVWEVAERVEK